MAKVIEAPFPDGKPTGLDELMSDLAEYVESGTVSSVAVAIVFKDGTHECGHCEIRTNAAMLGVLDILKAKILRKWFDG